jgi:antitoxin VapB
MADEKIAKLFMNGRSQAVRLPKEFRFEGDSVRIRREGNKVILEPVEPAEKRGWPPGFWDAFDKLPPISDEFEAAVRERLPDAPGRDELPNEYAQLADEQHDRRERAASVGEGTDMPRKQPRK